MAKGSFPFAKGGKKFGGDKKEAQPKGFKGGR